MENKESHAYKIQKLIFDIFGNDCTILKNTFSLDPNTDHKVSGEILVKFNHDISDKLNLKSILKIANVFTIAYDNVNYILNLKI